jgi:hypothetical protein
VLKLTKSTFSAVLAEVSQKSMSFYRAKASPSSFDTSRLEIKTAQKLVLHVCLIPDQDKGDARVSVFFRHLHSSRNFLEGLFSGYVVDEQHPGGPAKIAFRDRNEGVLATRVPNLDLNLELV